jgi:beta-xylosidase
VKELPTSDEFDGTALGMQWGWNHNPDSSNWSLTQNPGYLRLTTSKTTSSLREARNTLTQRPFANYDPAVPTTFTIRLEAVHMKDGDIAGLAVFQNPYAFIGVKKVQDPFIIMVNDGKAIIPLQWSIPPYTCAPRIQFHGRGLL